MKEPATSRFICRHLYNFFVADEPQVPAWTIEPARDEDALESMIDVFEESNYDMKAVLRFMFNSDFFKNARFEKIKSPAEVVAGTLRMVGQFQFPEPGIKDIGNQPTYMGQALMDPPSVEGWHTGSEWINSGSLLARINFVADRVADTTLPGVKSIVDKMKGDGISSSEQLLDACLDNMGYLVLNDETRDHLSQHAALAGNVDWSDESTTSERIGEMLALISATTEYQFA